MDTSKYGCAMLAGGEGKRMGRVNKADLEYDGRTFSERISAEMMKTGAKCYLSTAAYGQDIPEHWELVRDTVLTASGEYGGPMAGICSCLKKAAADGLEGLFFAPCDAPFFEISEIDELAKHIGPESDAVCWRTPDGRIQITFGWYSVRCIPVFEEDVLRGRLKILRTLEKMRLNAVDAAACGVGERVFANINTPYDYVSLRIF